MDRGYDDNKIFQKLFDAEQDFVIRLTQKRKFYYHNKWIFATELCNRRKGKVKMTLRYKGVLLFASIIEAAKPIKQKVNFLCYRLAFGIVELLSCAKQGIKDWFKPLCPNPFQMKLRLPA